MTDQVYGRCKYIFACGDPTGVIPPQSIPPNQWTKVRWDRVFSNTSIGYQLDENKTDWVHTDPDGNGIWATSAGVSFEQIGTKPYLRSIRMVGWSPGIQAMFGGALTGCEQDAIPYLPWMAGRKPAAVQTYIQEGWNPLENDGFRAWVEVWHDNPDGPVKLVHRGLYGPLLMSAKMGEW